MSVISSYVQGTFLSVNLLEAAFIYSIPEIYLIFIISMEMSLVQLYLDFLSLLKGRTRLPSGNIPRKLLVFFPLICFTLVIYVNSNPLKLRVYQRNNENLNFERGAFLIVEPRKHELMKFVLESFSRVVPKGWTLYIVHNQENSEFVKECCTLVGTERRIVSIIFEEHAILKDAVESGGYNKLFKTRDLWEMLAEDEEHVLVFQTDSLPCISKDLDIQRLGKFGYVGCSYEATVGRNHPFAAFWGNYAFYGIGGLSLRRLSFMKKCLDIYPESNCPVAEDVTFSACVDVLDYKYPVPKADDLSSFCAQGGWGNSLKPNSWAVHKFNQTMPEAKKQQFLTYCPNAFYV